MERALCYRARVKIGPHACSVELAIHSDYVRVYTKKKVARKTLIPRTLEVSQQTDLDCFVFAKTRSVDCPTLCLSE